MMGVITYPCWDWSSSSLHKSSATTRLTWVSATRSEQNLGHQMVMVMVMNDLLPPPVVQCQSDLPFWDTAILKCDHENPGSRSCVWSKVKVTFDLQNSKVKVMVKVKPIGHVWGLEFNRYVCFSFLGNWTIFGWDIANSIFDLGKSRSRSWSRSNQMVTFEP